MKKEVFKIKINKPCSENWDSMENHGAKRFCDSCSKMVVDFTAMNDQQVMEIISQSSSKICGQFREKQLNYTYSKIEEKNTNAVFPSLISSLLLFGTVSCIGDINTSQIHQTPITTQILMSEDTDAFSKKITQDLVMEISGLVLDADNKQPIPYVVITLKDTKIVARTDENGYFKLTIPEEIKAEFITLQLHYIGYEVMEYSVNRLSENQPIELYLAPQEMLLLGEVEIIRYEK